MDNRENTFEYQVLLNKHIIEKLPNRTSEICAAINGDTNEYLKQNISKYVDETTGSKVFVEKLDGYLDLHLCDPSDVDVSVIGVSTTDDATTEKISTTTYQTLTDLAVDFDVADMDAQQELRHAI